MLIGLLTLELEIPEATSLKGKRAVLTKIKSRVRNKFNVSIAEVEGNEVWNYACLGVAVISNNQKFANQVLDKIVDFVEEFRDCEIEAHAMEFLRLSIEG